MGIFSRIRRARVAAPAPIEVELSSTSTGRLALRLKDAVDREKPSEDYARAAFNYLMVGGEGERLQAEYATEHVTPDVRVFVRKLGGVRYEILLPENEKRHVRSALMRLTERSWQMIHEHRQTESRQLAAEFLEKLDG